MGGGCGESPGHQRPLAHKGEKQKLEAPAWKGRWRGRCLSLTSWPNWWQAPTPARPEALALPVPVRGRVCPKRRQICPHGLAICCCANPIDQAGGPLRRGNPTRAWLLARGRAVHGRGACQQDWPWPWGLLSGPWRPARNLLFRPDESGRRQAQRPSSTGLLRAATGCQPSNLTISIGRIAVAHPA